MKYIAKNTEVDAFYYERFGDNRLFLEFLVKNKARNQVSIELEDGKLARLYMVHPWDNEEREEEVPCKSWLVYTDGVWLWYKEKEFNDHYEKEVA